MSWAAELVSMAIWSLAYCESSSTAVQVSDNALHPSGDRARRVSFIKTGNTVVEIVLDIKL